MERQVYKELLAWKNSKNRKPLILNGARQIGKTWILKEFGKREYKNVAYINCETSDEMKMMFSNFDVKRLIRGFSSITGENILPEETLIILDEIQETPLGITALKYFCENAREYHIIVAGSLLGIKLRSGTGFPVGKVDEITMYPMTFLEFMYASGNGLLAEQIQEHRWEDFAPFSTKFTDLLRQYYYVGGMPEVVQEYIDNENLNEVRIIQKRILTDYEQDFSKHVPDSLLPKVIMVWNSIPSQLAKENKKFIYGTVKKGSRAKDFEDAIQWLMNAGLLHKVIRVNKVQRPLKFYEDVNAFKIFLSDLGLLGAMADVTAKEVLTGVNYFSEYKGAFTEQYVAQDLIANGNKLYYYSKENSPLEIDFLVQKDELYPIEVKAEENVKAKSLRTLYEDNNRLKPVRFSMSGYRKQDWMVNVPLYLASEWIQSVE
uniref:ATP-binding protein n=1 Tax=Eubacterium cellulosolvens TaxID=29322 RepID=UPI000489FD76|nr:ATP-binding protein [[Eubacterium] cellulosolvens]